MRRLRAFQRFREQPSSIRHASVAIMSAALLVIVAGAVLVRVFDAAEYPSFGRALWFTLQTVTTVGYGDVTPTTTLGRVVAGVVMLTAFGLIAVVTATITSVFIAAAQAEAGLGGRQDQREELAATQRIEALLIAIQDRLDRLEAGFDTNQTVTDEGESGDADPSALRRPTDDE